ncbi:MAG: peroxide stress protein YaaA, partial [Candidatus Omnitrophica bacterium]|nr:peroxide stress protein YaaA [Candidatus Omnitrophota bacterium]
MSQVVILIPPSEGKAASGDEKPLGCFSTDIKVMHDRLTAYRGDLSALYGVKGKALEAAKTANAQLLTSPTLEAIFRYSGVVYDGIDYSTLPPKARNFFNDHVRIISAL